jgi:hypothetical protein
VEDTEEQAAAGRLRQTPQISALRLLLGLLVAVAALSRHLPNRPVLVIAAFIVLGAFFWKVPPYEVGRELGLSEGFFGLALERGLHACQVAGAWAAGFTVWGILSGALVGLLRANNSRFFHDVVGGAVWGALGGAVVGAVVWAAQQAGRDVEILQDELD